MPKRNMPYIKTPYIPTKMLSLRRENSQTFAWYLRPISYIRGTVIYTPYFGMECGVFYYGFSMPDTLSVFLNNVQKTVDFLLVDVYTVFEQCSKAVFDGS